jgi:predicted CxxxxCH...CXXCH cytochrome family protein
MTSIKTLGLPAAAVLAFLAAGCADSRPAAQGQGGLVSDGCVLCHGDVGRTGNLPGTDQNLRASPPAAPAGQPTSVVGAHQAHVNPPATGALRGPILCNECHVVPTSLAHATNPPANPVVFGTLARTQNNSPTWNETTTGCSATYCHGGFDFDGVRGAAATPLWTGTTITCIDCHGLPPTGHPTLPGTVTAATCNICHPATVKADGTIDVAGGKHVNGLAEFEGGHTDPNWADPTHHGYQANANGLQTCTSCHVGFGGASGVAAGSCNTCHANAGFPAWQTTCTFCHGTTGRTGNLAGTDLKLAAAPPVGTQGESAATTVAVGAHQAHVNPTAAAALANPFGCSVCHPSPLPVDVAHVDGSAPPVVFSGVAGSGTYNRNANPPTCSSTYCHGTTLNGGTNRSPSWNGGSSQAACGTCHSVAYSTLGGHHNSPSEHRQSCDYCHGAGYSATAVTGAAVATHVNGLPITIKAGNPPGWIPSSRSCNNGTGCHGGTKGPW